MNIDFRPAESPTMYFVGVSTTQSAIHRVFAAWKPLLGMSDAQLVGIDLPLDASSSEYREVVTHLTTDEQSLGALVTTHKLNLYRACEDLFAEINPDARALQEVSCLATADGVLRGLALDATTSGLALAAITPSLANKDVLLFGAGGAALALAHYLSSLSLSSAPKRVIVTDIKQRNLDALAALISSSDSPSTWEYHLVKAGNPQDTLFEGLDEGALIVNATGMGKDRPGSPISDTAVFPMNSICWEFNYRGSLEFLHQSRAKADSRQLQVHDGWIYFIHGWTRAIAEVFSISIPTEGSAFDELVLAAEVGR